MAKYKSSRSKFPLNVFWEIFYGLNIALPCDVEETMLELIELLPDNQKKAIYLVYRDKLTLKEAERELGVSAVQIGKYIDEAFYQLYRGTPNGKNILFKTRLLRGKKFDNILGPYRGTDTPIINLNLSRRAKTALFRYLYTIENVEETPTIGHVVSLSINQIRSIKGIGKTTCEEIIWLLKNDYNIAF